VADTVLEQMHKEGVRGLRFVEAPSPTGAPRPGSVNFSQIDGLAGRMKDLDWSINIWAKLPVIIQNLKKILDPDLPVVVEHMGMLDPSKGLHDADYQTLLSLLKENRIWVKLSFCRCSQQAPTYEDLKPFFDAFIEANEDRLIWGSDWPYVRMQGQEPDAGHLLELMTEWVGDQHIIDKILATNPERLYQFSEKVAS
jgi:predicted TIM-barrel fold metal-dependent hydrolase